MKLAKELRAFVRSMEITRSGPNIEGKDMTAKVEIAILGGAFGFPQGVTVAASGVDEIVAWDKVRMRGRSWRVLLLPEEET